MVEGLVDTAIADASAEARRLSNIADAGRASRPADGGDSSAYRAITGLASQEPRVNTAELSLAAGMPLTAEIAEDQRTLLEYLLSPVHRIASEAGRER